MGRRLEGGRFFGRTLRKRSVGDLTMADVVYPAGTPLPLHCHERAYFCLIRRGGYTETYGRRMRECRPMTLVFHPAGESHRQKFSGSPVASFNVEIGGDWLTSNLDQPAEFHGGSIADLGMKLFGEFQHGGAVEIEALASEIMVAIAGQSEKPTGDPQPRWLREARDLLDARFRERLTLRGIAHEARIHPVYFAAAFRRFYHRSVGEYLRWRRLEYVRAKLSEPELSLAEIALDAGFADQSHLTRNFKRFTGRTPGEYRTFLRFKTD